MALMRLLSKATARSTFAVRQVLASSSSPTAGCKVGMQVNGLRLSCSLSPSDPCRIHNVDFSHLASYWLPMDDSWCACDVNGGLIHSRAAAIVMSGSCSSVSVKRSCFQQAHVRWCWSSEAQGNRRPIKNLYQAIPEFSVSQLG